MYDNCWRMPLSSTNTPFAHSLKLRFRLLSPSLDLRRVEIRRGNKPPHFIEEIFDALNRLGDEQENLCPFHFAAQTIKFIQDVLLATLKSVQLVRQSCRGCLAVYEIYDAEGGP